jgi:glutaredoxin
VPKTELFGSSECPYTREMREWLEWKGRDFREFDVSKDSEALERLKALTGQSSVPALLEDGKTAMIGWHGRACFVGAGDSK